MHWAKVDLAQEYIVAANNIHSWTAINPNTGIVYEGRLGRASFRSLLMSITRGGQIRFRQFKIGVVMKCLTALLAAVIFTAGVVGTHTTATILQPPRAPTSP